jgi:hypothetical protein
MVIVRPSQYTAQGRAPLMNRKVTLFRKRDPSARITKKALGLLCASNTIVLELIVTLPRHVTPGSIVIPLALSRELPHGKRTKQSNARLASASA